MGKLIVRRQGTLIDIGGPGLTEIPAQALGLVAPYLSYDHKKIIRGNKYSPDGSKQGVEVTRRKMYRIEQGRLLTGFGFLTRVWNTLQNAGYQLEYHDISPARSRDDVYEPKWDNMLARTQFRPGQEACVRAIMDNPCGLIDAAAGFGKTFIFEALCHLYPYAKFDIVVRPKDVAARIVQQLTRSVPNVGMVGGGKVEYGPRVTVYTAGSIHRSPGEADFLLADEVHQLVTDKTAKALGETYQFSRNFGFSATIGTRNDGADAQLECFFGQTIYKLPYPEAVAMGLVVPVRVRWLPIRMETNPCTGRHGVSRDRWGLWRNHVRNRIVAEDAIANYGDPSQQVLMLVATIDHAVHLWQHLPNYHLCYGSMKTDQVEQHIRNRMLPHGFRPVTAEVRENMRQAFSTGELKKVIATDVWATGVSFDSLCVVYRLDGRESENIGVQSTLRVSRIDPGKQEGIVVDCMDYFDKTLLRKSQARRRIYEKQGFVNELQTMSQIDGA